MLRVNSSCSRPHPELILASASPRRRQLLALLGLPFKAVEADIEERVADSETPIDVALRLSQAKVRAVAKVYQQGLILGADTIVVHNESILGKPTDTLEATTMLQRLRRGPHRVYTGLTVLDNRVGQWMSDVTETVVWMRRYSEEEIARYVARGEPFDKAGGYAIQDQDFQPVARIEGCYASVMGLPLCRVYQVLLEVGLKPAEKPSSIPCLERGPPLQIQFSQFGQDRLCVIPLLQPDLSRDCPILEEDYAIGVAGRFGVVGDHDNSLAQFVTRAAQQSQYLLPGS